MAGSLYEAAVILGAEAQAMNDWTTTEPYAIMGYTAHNPARLLEIGRLSPTGNILYGGLMLVVNDDGHLRWRLWQNRTDGWYGWHDLIESEQDGGGSVGHHPPLYP